MEDGRLIPVLIMYFIAGYIKRFVDVKRIDMRRCLVIAITGYVLLFATFYGFTYWGEVCDSQGIMDNRYFYRVLNSPFVVLISIELFMFFLKLNLKQSKVINEIASCTFGVYLLHSNRLMSGYLCQLFPIYKEARPLFIFIYSSFSVVIIYLVSTLIEYIRKVTVGKLCEKILDVYFVSKQNRTEYRR